MLHEQQGRKGEERGTGEIYQAAQAEWHHAHCFDYLVDIAVIGCIVNGPGEAKVADIGLTGASPANLVYQNGKKSHKVSNENIVDELEKMARAKADEIRLKEIEDEKKIALKNIST